MWGLTRCLRPRVSVDVGEGKLRVEWSQNLDARDETLVVAVLETFARTESRERGG